jgi:rhodanese-related sulfurtransferase
MLARSGSGDVVVVDVRPRLEYEAGHLPGAINIPLDDLSQHLSDFDTDTTIVAYCRGPYCVLAAQAVAQLRDAGLQAQRLDGGPLEWSAAGLPLTLPSDDATAHGVAAN